MTTRLYYTDAYLTAFDARVVDRSDDGRRVYLDRTAFYPTSGGQPNDVGMLGGVAVTDVVDEGERVAHVLAEPLPGSLAVPDDSADRVAGRIDWTRRFDHMQQHTGQHLLSAIFAELFGYGTVSVHFGAESSTLDLDTKGRALDRDALVAAETRANELVAEARPVSVSFEDAAAAAEGGLRRQSKREGTLRIVTIEGVDRSACGGTHVRSTAAIGAVLLRRTERIRQATRVEFVCGLRAVGRARRDYEALSRAAASLSAAIDDLPALVAAQSDQARAAENAQRRLSQELWRYRARELYEATTPDASGVRHAIVRRAPDEPGGTPDDLRSLAQAFVLLPRAVLAGAAGDPPTIVLASSEDSGVNAGATLKPALAAVGGRGGGSPRLAQGSVGIEKLDEVLRELS